MPAFQCHVAGSTGQCEPTRGSGLTIQACMHVCHPRATARSGSVQILHPNWSFPVRRAPFGSFPGLAGTQSFASELSVSRAPCTFCAWCTALPARKVNMQEGANRSVLVRGAPFELIAGLCWYTKLACMKLQIAPFTCVVHVLALLHDFAGTQSLHA